ncbi:MAG TPA: Ppx/GppA phosphatase family protein [Hyphomicrobiales bacterium]|nr:Ppx/GppA phosphatase family protein [Hyphomicrobiales bacterium]
MDDLPPPVTADPTPALPAARPAMPRAAAIPCYAALDLGTNNCRLLVARPTADGFRVIDAFSRIVRLGEGLGTSGRLAEDAMARAVEALEVCRAKMATRGVARSRLIATEACRSAANGRDFCSRVRDTTGLDLEIVDRATEARLAALGCAPLVDPDAAGVVLFDIGGGSSELVWMERPERRFDAEPRIRAWISLPVGVVTLAERHGGVHVTPEIFDAMVEEVDGLLGAFPEGEALAREAARLHMLGTSGTVTTMAGVHLDLPRYDRRRVDGIWMSDGDIAAVTRRLCAMSYDERVASPCIGHDRADLVLAGCAILEAIRSRFGCRRLRVADRGLREGLLIEMMRADGAWRRRPRSWQRGRGGGRR